LLIFSSGCLFKEQKHSTVAFWVNSQGMPFLLSPWQSEKPLPSQMPGACFSVSEVSLAQVAALSEASGTDGRPFNKQPKAACCVTGTEAVMNGFHFRQG